MIRFNILIAVIRAMIYFSWISHKIIYLVPTVDIGSMIQKQFYNVNHSFLNSHNQGSITLLWWHAKRSCYKSLVHISQNVKLRVRVRVRHHLRILTSTEGVLISAPLSISTVTRSLLPVWRARSTAVKPSWYHWYQRKIR